LNLGTETQRLAGGFDGVQLMPAAGDEYFLGQGKMQKADFLGGAAQAADEIGEDAVKAGLAPLQLLMLVGSDESARAGWGSSGVVARYWQARISARLKWSQSQPPSGAGGSSTLSCSDDPSGRKR
jgi:hypothetical protein